MLGDLVCVAALALGIDVGWRPLSDGGVEYLIQIEPGLIEALKPGEAIGSDVPPRLIGEIRAYRITVGTEELPRELPPPTGAEPAQPAGSPGQTPGSAPPAMPGDTTPSPGPVRPGPQATLPEGPGGSGDADPPGLAAPGSRAPRAGRAEQPESAGAQPRTEPQPSPPNLLPGVSARKPLTAEQAVFHMARGDGGPAAPEEKPEQDTPAEEKPKPWAPLVVSLLGLFASLGANAYLGWVALDFRARYQKLVQRAFESTAGN